MLVASDSEVATFFRGRGRFDGGVARIPVPDDFRIVTEPEGLTAHVTPIGMPASTWLERLDTDELVIRSNRDVEFSYIVYGVRRGFAQFEPVHESSVFKPESATSSIPNYVSEDAKKRLISNGTYNPDGTVNTNTARRLGWFETKDVQP